MASDPVQVSKTSKIKKTEKELPRKKKEALLAHHPRDVRQKRINSSHCVHGRTWLT
jgi:hypothetical protein